MQIYAGDTVIFRDKSRGVERGGRALGQATDKGLWVDMAPKSNSAMAHAFWVRPDDVIEVRPVTTDDKLAVLKRALVHGEGECKVVSSRPSYFKRSAGVRR